MSERIPDTLTLPTASRNGEQTPKERRLPITTQQLALLARSELGVREAERRHQLVVAAVLAGHALESATVLRIEDGPVLVVQVPET